MKEINNIAVLGAGQMGHGITQVAAMAGFEVHLTDISEDSLNRGLSKINKSVEKLVAKGKVEPEAMEVILGRVKTTTRLEEALDGAEAVIEAATENAEMKFDIFKKVDKLAHPDALLLSNTSSVSITHIAGQTGRPERVMGMHFMNPVPLMRLVELIRGLVTAEETFQETEVLAHRMGKETVSSEDYPGFIVNRILVPMINEACYALMERVADVEDIDQALRLGANHPMGPLQLADLIGLDTCLSIMEILHSDMGDAKYRPCPLLQRYVRAGFLGRKSGRGFYHY